MLEIDDKNIGRDRGYFMSTDTDSEYVVKPVKFFGLSQEEAGLHAALRGAGLKDMLDKEGRTWMILRTRMNIGSYPSWGDSYSIETWCQKGFKLYCPRAVRAFTTEGDLIFLSESLWVVMDTVKKRPERPSYIEPRLPETEDKSILFNPDFERFPSEDEYSGASFSDEEIHIDYYDYDYNRHVNNLSYINWMMSSFPPEYLDSHRPFFIDCEWKKQCHFEDRLFARTKRKNEEEEKYFTSIYRLTDEGEEVVFHAVSEWKEKQNER